MDPVLIIIIIILVIGFAAGFFFINRKFKDLKETKEKDQSFLLLNQNIQGMQQRIDVTQKAISERLDNAAKVIHGVQRELGSMQEIGRSMKDLQDFLKSPKLRGNIGEQVLRDLLEQYFPRPNFELQYKFSDNTQVDAVIKTKQGLIPIDSKFPMENFQKMAKTESEEARETYRREFLKDVKKHIQSISKKYILPTEGTMDFALMYIPSETVYYEIIREHTDLTQYAYQEKVYPVSPNSFYFFLQAILKMMEGERIQEAAEKILSTLSAIQKDSEKFSETLGVLTTHLTNAKNAMDRVNAEYFKLSGKIDQIRLLK